MSSLKTSSLEHLNPLAVRSLAAAAFRSSYPTRGQSIPIIIIIVYYCVLLFIREGKGRGGGKHEGKNKGEGERKNCGGGEEGKRRRIIKNKEHEAKEDNEERANTY